MKPKILIITALEEELLTLKELFPAPGEPVITGEGLSIYGVSLPKIDVAYTCFYTMGNINSASLTPSCIRVVKPDLIIMFGICGGIKDLDFGDVVVSDEIFYYESAKVGPAKIEYRGTNLPVDPKLVRKIKSLVSNTEWNYSIKVGKFGVGEKVVSNVKFANDLLEREPKLLAVEMESYGVFVAALNEISAPMFIAVRGVSDLADEKKNDNYRKLALKNAGEFLEYLLENLKISRVVSSNTQKFLAIHHLSLDGRTSVQTSLASAEEFRDYEVDTLELDQTSYFQDGKLTSPNSAFASQEKAIQNLKDKLSNKPDLQLGYFSIAHIPFVVDFGYELQRQQVNLYELNRFRGQWVPFKEGGEPLRLKEIFLANEEAAKRDKEVVLVIEISSQILNQDVQAVIHSDFCFISLGLEEPRPDAISSISHVWQFSERFRKIINRVKSEFPEVETIHLFYSGPVSLAFSIGQQITKTNDPKFVVYNYSVKDDPHYGWSIELGTNIVNDYR